jgi:hypothetical protein
VWLVACSYPRPGPPHTRIGDCLVGAAVVSGSRGEGARQPVSRDMDSYCCPRPGPPHARTGDYLVGITVVSGSRGAKRSTPACLLGYRFLLLPLGQGLHMREQAIVWLAQLSYLAHAVQKEHTSLPPGI